MALITLAPLTAESATVPATLAVALKGTDERHLKGGRGGIAFKYAHDFDNPV